MRECDERVRIEQARTVLVGILNAIILTVLAVKVWQKAAESARYGDQTAVLYWPTAPVFYFISLCLGCSALIAMSLAWWYLKGHSTDAARR